MWQMTENHHQLWFLPVNLLDSVAIQTANLFCRLHNACRSSVGQAVPDGVFESAASVLVETSKTARYPKPFS